MGNYIDDYLNSEFAKSILKTNKKGSNYAVLFPLYRGYLLGKVVRIFEWKGLPFDQRHIEIPLLLSGRVWVTRYKDKLIANPGSTGVTDDIYWDEVKTGFCHTNKKGDLPMINHVNSILGRNDTLTRGIMPIIDMYADLMTHAHLTFVNTLVNDRSTQVFKAMEGSTAESANNFINKRFQGIQAIITDDLADMIDVKDLGHSGGYSELQGIREALLIAFFKEFGIKTESEKKERLLVDEVNEDNGAMGVTISDMLECRAKLIEEAAELFPEFEAVTVQPRVDYLQEEGEERHEDE